MATSIESLLAAYNFVRYMYATGAGMKSFGRVFIYQDWDSLVRQGAELIQLKPEIAVPGVSVDLDDIQDALRAASAWSLLDSPAGLVFTHVDPVEKRHFPILLLTTDGRLGVYPATLSGTTPVKPGHEEHLRLVEGATAPIVDRGDRPDSLARFDTISLWTISATLDEGLAFRYKGELKLDILADGRAWSSSNYGFFALGEACRLDENDALAAPELKRLWPPYSQQEAYCGWSIAITYSGCLAISKSGQRAMILRPDGALWSAGAGGWVKTRPARDLIRPDLSHYYYLPESVQADGSILGCACPIKAGAESYFLTGLTSCALSNPPAWFAGAPARSDGGYDVPVEWSNVSLDSFARWLGLEKD